MTGNLTIPSTLFALVMLSGCGGGGDGGGTASAGTAPPPVAQVNTSLTPLQYSETFDTSPVAAIQYTLSRSTLGVTSRSAPSTGATAQVRYEAGTASYTLIGTAVPQVTFSASDKNAQSTATVTAYQRTTGGRQDNLALVNPGTANAGLTLTYVTYGAQQSITDNGNALDVDTAFFTFGVATAAADVPRSGSASYRTTMDAQFADTAGAYAVGGTSSLTADFSAATVAFSMAPVGTNVVSGATKSFGTITVNAPFQSNDRSRFSGTGSPNGAGYSASLAGKFYGPQAAEVGATFVMTGNNGFGAGAVVGRKN